MENNMKKFDDLFREALSDHEEVPPQRVWESLDKRLGARVGTKSVGSGWYWYVCIASFAVLLGGLGWSMLRSEDAPVAKAPTVPAMAAGSNTTHKVATETAEPEETPATDNAAKRTATTMTGQSGGGDKVVDKSVKDVTPYGNAVAVGTSVHSYDDFEERAAANAHRNTTNAGDEHVASGYRINKIRKHGLKAAEMVPVGNERGDVLAASVAPKVPINDEPAIPAKTSVRRRAATVKKIVTDDQRRTVKQEVTSNADAASKEKVAEAATDKVTPATRAAIETTPAATSAVETTAPASPAAAHPETLIATSASKPAVTGSAIVPKAKPATVVPQGKPSTGGSEPPVTKATNNDSSAKDGEQADDASGGQKQKGLRGIFRRMKKNNK
jgi:hypothetical protein